MLENKLNRYLKSLESLPEQGSVTWLEHRKLSIGGSELKTLITNKSTLIMNKLGLAPYKDSMPTLWGSILEDLTHILTSIVIGCKIYNAPGSIPSCQVKGKTYSPDGFGVSSLHEKDKMIVLFEFKTLYSRIIKQDVIIPTYMPQVLSGIDDLDIVDKAIFSECFIRTCSIDDLLKKNLTINNRIHKELTEYNNILADGILFFYFDSNNEWPTDSIYLDFLDTLTNLFRDNKIYSTVDLGCQDQSNLFRLFYLVKYNILSMKILPINTYPNNWDRVNWCKKNTLPPNLCTDHHKNILKTSKWANKKEHVIIGYLPWKLFDMNIVKVEPVEGYVKQYEDLIVDTLEEIKELSSLNDHEMIQTFNHRYLGNGKRNPIGPVEDDPIDKNLIDLLAEF